MSDGLSVIRRAYGLDAPDASDASGAEAAVLTQSMAALDALPRQRPDADVLAAVAARAANASREDALGPLREVIASDGALTSASGAEATLLAQSLLALDTLPTASPSPEAVAAVLARAEAASLEPVRLATGDVTGTDVTGTDLTDADADSPEAQILQQSLAALDTLPAYAPSPEALAAVLARAQESALEPVAAEIGDLAEAGPDSPEAEILRQSMAALDALPAATPSPEVLGAVFAYAADASVAPVLAAYGEGTSDSPEVEMLRQSVAALDTLPAQSPSPEARDAVTVHAAAASAAPVLAAYGEVSGVDSPEVPLLAASRQALDTLPTYAPSAAAMAAVMAAAAEASGAAMPVEGTAPATAAPATAAPAARPKRRAKDRGAAVAARPRTRIGALAGLSTLAVAILAGLLFLRSGDSLAPEADIVALAEPAPEEAPVASAPAEPLADLAPEPEPTPEAAPPEPPRPIVPRTAPRGPNADGFQPVAAQRPAPSPPSAARARSAPEAEAAFMADAMPAEADASASGDAAPTDWDAGDDVRLLSLRLRQLREENAGLEWGEPAVPLGQSARTAGTTPGVQAVRESAPMGRALARTPVQDR